MSVRKRRCLLATAAIFWLAWVVALVGAMFVDVGSHHVMAMYAVLAIAITCTLVFAVYSTAAPVLAALRALRASRCEECAGR